MTIPKNIFLTLTIVLFFNLAFSQRIKLTEITLAPGFYSENISSNSINDFNTLAPNSELLPPNFNDYKTSIGRNSNSDGVSTSILLGFQFKQKDNSEYKSNPLLRVGLTYKYGRTLSAFTYKESRQTIDTLISQNTGQAYSLDSISIDQYNLRYNTQQIKLDISLIFRTDPQIRWGFYSGFGGSIGTTINPKTSIEHFQHNSTSTKDEVYPLFFGPNTISQHANESFTNQNHMVYSCYIPLGLDFRVSKENEFWKKIHLFYEMQLTLNITPIPELRTYTNLAFQNNLGLKFSWN